MVRRGLGLGHCPHRAPQSMFSFYTADVIPPGGGMMDGGGSCGWTARHPWLLPILLQPCSAAGTTGTLRRYSSTMWPLLMVCDAPCRCQVQEAFTFGVALELARARAAEKVRSGGQRRLPWAVSVLNEQWPHHPAVFVASCTLLSLGH